MQRYMYIEKDDHGIFVPMDSPIGFTLEKYDDRVDINLTMGKYERVGSIDKSKELCIDEHYDWCKTNTIEIITWFLSSDLKVFDSSLFFLCFMKEDPFEGFKSNYKNNL